MLSRRERDEACLSFLDTAGQEFDDIDGDDVSTQASLSRANSQNDFLNDQISLIDNVTPVHQQQQQQQQQQTPEQPEQQQQQQREECNANDVSGECGIWKLRGKWCSRLNQFELFLILLAVSGFCTGIQGALKSALLTKLEKRFHLNSKTSSLIVSANDMVFLPSVLLVSYFGSLGHRPRILALSCFGYGLASVLFSMPYFIFGAQPTPKEGADLFRKFGFQCQSGGGSNASNSFNNNTLEDEGYDEFESKFSLFIFMISGFLEGLSAAPYWNLGVAFVDDITGDMSGVFVGLIIAARILSPSLGYQLYGKVLVRITENLETAQSYQISHPRYIPAWWLGFICVGVIAMVTAFPMALFPRKPNFNAEKYRRGGEGIWRVFKFCNRKAKQATNSSNGEEAKRIQNNSNLNARLETASKSFAGFFSAIKRLVSNPVYISLLCGNMFEFMEINCVIAYMAKYLEMHFRIPSGDAAALTGMAVPGANAVGILISSVIASQVTWRVPQLARFHAIVNCFGIIAAAAGLFFTCPTVEFMSGLQSYSQTPFQQMHCTVSNSNSNSSSSGSCNCSSATFLPICLNGVNHFNPCSARCYGIKGKVTCGCINQPQLSFPISSLRQETGRVCPDSDCNRAVYVFMAIYVLTKLVRLSARSQEAVLQMRCVRQKDKALGLGVNSFAFSIGGIWVPIFVGYLFDQACIFTNPALSDTPGKSSSKSCLFYDSIKFRYSFCGFTTAALIPACGFFFLAWYFTEKSSKYTNVNGNVEININDDNAGANVAGNDLTSFDDNCEGKDGSEGETLELKMDLKKEEMNE